MIDVDTAKIKQCGNDIIKLSQDLSKLCTAVYDRINNMSKTTLEWQGSSAQEFSRKAMLEKNNAIDLKNQLYTFGNLMVKSANNYENTARQMIYR